MRHSARNSGITWIEVLVILIVVCALMMMALPRITAGPARGKSVMTQSLSNMRQLQIATQTMVKDGVLKGNPNLKLPGDTGGKFSNWAESLVPAYLSTNAFCKLLCAPGKVVPSLDKIPTMGESAILVYAVSEESSSNTVFLTTANFTNTPTGGTAPLPTARPYGDKGFAVFRTGGDGAIYRANQAGPANPYLIGAFAPLCQ